MTLIHLGTGFSQNPERFTLIPRWKTAVAGVAMTLAASCGCASHPDSAPVSITFSDGFSSTHPIGKGGAQPFREYLEEHGPGVGLDVEYFAAGQLGKPKDALHLLRAGAVDISPFIPAYLSNDIPLSSVGELPGLVEDPCAGVEALMPMMKPGGSIYEEEMKEQGVVPLWGVMIPNYKVFTTNKPITRPSELEGSLIRTPGGVGDRVVRELGASGVILSNSDLYEAVARGTVDGAIFPEMSVKSYSLQEVLKYVADDANLYTTTVLYAVSADQWQSFTEEQKAVLDKASEVAQEGACRSLLEAQESARAAILDADVEFVHIDESTKQEWNSALTPIRDNWISDLESVGLPASSVLSEFEDRLAKENR
ncbi:TRAP transporter substrate-binding protein DctP [Rhodococcus opacus]|uniref:TRAP transporter substrate-binding protein n=1 Tax=Rhodococcus opacus TaxID=37919 RepID=UPI001F51CD6F|nr:TRAP transporter substrate-binding protein DctP [Rhodococcus opacus]